MILTKKKPGEEKETTLLTQGRSTAETTCGSAGPPVVLWIRTLEKSKGNFCIYNPRTSLVVRQWQNFYKREQCSNFRWLWCFAWFCTHFWIFGTISYWQALGVCSTLLIFIKYSYSHGLCNYFPWCAFLRRFKEGTILVNNSPLHFRTFSFSNEHCVLPIWLY